MQLEIATPLERDRGFTLFELLIVVAIIGAMSMVAIPQLLDAREDYRLTATASSLAGNCANARILAVTRNSGIRVTVVNATTYVLQQKIGGVWTTQESYELPPDFTIAATGNVEFQPRGNATPQTTFTITNPNGRTRSVVVETSGRAHAQ